MTPETDQICSICHR